MTTTLIENSNGNLGSKIKWLFVNQRDLQIKLIYAHQYARLGQNLDKSGKAKKCLDALDKFLKDKSKKNKCDLKSAYSAALEAIHIYSSVSYAASRAKNAVGNIVTNDVAGSATCAACRAVESVTNTTKESRESARDWTVRIALQTSYSAEHIQKLTELTNKLTDELTKKGVTN